MTDPSGRVVAETRAWLQRAVVGLGLCPFARAPLANDTIRYVVCASDDPRELLDLLCEQMNALAEAAPAALETTLVIHPNVLLDFDAYNDFLDAADAALDELGLEGIVQIASFHPRYRFADTADGDIANATNRSPHPMLHLLREASVGRAVASLPDADAVYRANIATLEALGAAGWSALQAACRADADRVFPLPRS